MNKYKEEIEKMAAIGAIAGTAAKLGTKALAGAKSFAGMSTAKRVATGSALGGITGGAKHDPNSGQSRASSVINGAINGGALGGMASAKNFSGMKNMLGGKKSTSVVPSAQSNYGNQSQKRINGTMITPQFTVS